MPENTNALIDATSPYLLQHAHNPVNWYPWGETALEKAKAEDKPILLSIGYSSCHWCHVMERESFENDSIAAIMNTHFISIKVDREERPDVDQVYMDAVQAMGQGGGWPLNVFLTPDQRPFYGGTYFPPKAWAQLLVNIADAYKSKRKEITESANQLTDALSTSELVKYNLTASDGPAYPKERLDAMYAALAKRFDTNRGGMNKAPKFPMPGQWNFLLQYYHYSGNKQALEQVILTLDEMAGGGIYDQVGGGFARYSVDGDWLVPHFEKMLYDNGQLLSLYAQAYKTTKKLAYRQVVNQTIEWLTREMLDDGGGFYAALDADSEGEEGKFYVWSASEFEKVLGGRGLMKSYYQVSENGNWEEGKNILHRKQSDEGFAQKNGLSVVELRKEVGAANTQLLKARTSRIRPGLDDKVLSGWNGLLLKGLCDAYDAFGEGRFLMLAINNATFISEKMMADGRLYRSYKAGKVSIPAYLEDYAAIISGFIGLYQSTFDEQWLDKAKALTDYTIDHFYDKEEQFFYFTDSDSESLIARKKEVFDNVIPSSNAMMAHNLHSLGLFYDDERYHSIAATMLSAVSELAGKEPAYMYHWAALYAERANNTAEIAIVGDGAEEMRAKFAAHYLPNKVLMGARQDSSLPLLKGKSTRKGETTVFVCYNKTCKLPVHNFEAALQQLK